MIQSKVYEKYNRIKVDDDSEKSNNKIVGISTHVARFVCTDVESRQNDWVSIYVSLSCKKKTHINSVRYEYCFPTLISIKTTS